MQKIKPLELTWQVETTRDIVVGPEGRTVLQLAGKMDGQLNHAHLTFPDAPDGMLISVVVGQQAIATTGAGSLKVQTVGAKVPIVARQDLPYEIVFTPVIFEQFMHEPGSGKDHWWTWAGQKEELCFGPGFILGVLVRTSLPARCRAKAGGR